MKRIAIFGAHGSAKTTLVYKLAAYFKMKNKNVTVIHETARQSPFPINDGVVYQTTLHVVTSQIKKELEAEGEGFEICISDRTASDAFVYINYFKRDNNLTRSLEEFCLEWIRQYDVLVYLIPSEGFEITDDGVRACDIDFQRGIRDDFDQLIEKVEQKHRDKLSLIKAEAQQVFDENLSIELMDKIKGSLFNECRESNLV